jgi:hypothetical protein
MQNTTLLQVHTSPPTSAAASYHIQGVHLQRPTVQSKPHISHNCIVSVTVKLRATSYLISRLGAGGKFVLIGKRLPSIFPHPR